MDIPICLENEWYKSISVAQHLKTYVNVHHHEKLHLSCLLIIETCVHVH